MIGYVTIRITNVFEKGVAIKDVSTTAQTIIDDMSRSIKSSPSVKIIEQVSSSKEKVGAYMCTGIYSYAWNYGKAIKEGIKELIKDNNDKVINLIRFKDREENWCGREPTISSYDEIIGNSERQLALHSFELKSSKKSESTEQVFYNISFVLGTFEDDLINTSDDSCKAPADLDGKEGNVGNHNYCAINKFNFAVRSIAGKGKY